MALTSEPLTALSVPLPAADELVRAAAAFLPLDVEATELLLLAHGATTLEVLHRFAFARS